MSKAYLKIALKISEANRPAAAGVYAKYKQPFLDTIKGAVSKELLIRNENVAVLHGFNTVADAEGYLVSGLFSNDVVTGLKPFLEDNPIVEIYTVA